MSNLMWLQEWYKSQCDGDWEHSYGVKIESLDNPGWSITIETEDSINELKDFDWKNTEISENDWYYYRVVKSAYEASGDPQKLEKLISIFRDLIENTVSAE